MALLEWARARKREGKLKAVFRAYLWWRSSVVFPIKLWWKSKPAFLIWQWAARIRPEWVQARYYLGGALEARYHRLAASRHFDADELLDAGNRAIGCYKTVIALQPDRFEAYQRLWGLLFVMGRVDEAAAILRQAVEAQKRFAEAHQLDQLGLRFLPTEQVTGNVGVLGMLDGYIKAGILGWRPAHKVIMLMTCNQSVTNRCFLNYWCRYITIISDHVTIKILSPIARYLEDPFNWALTLSDQKLFWHSAAAMIQKQWYAEKRAPLLAISPTDFERGWRCLEELGMPRDAWFVCLHVREAGFKDGDSSVDSYRNADIETYLLAVKTIVARGGWVIRMGDPTMTRLPSMEHVIDYAHSGVRSDWMDVFCCARCRFFLGTSSGLYTIASAFGVPYVQTNYLPMCTLWFSSQDLFIPKLCRSRKESRDLSFTELLSPPLSTSCVQSSYDLAGVEVLDNTPEEIKEVVLEMLDRLDGRPNYTEDDKRLQERFNTLTATCGTLVGLRDFKVQCRIGREFLRSHRQLLPQTVELISTPTLN